MSADLLPPTMREYLSHESLRPLWAALRRRLEGNGLQATGTLTHGLDEPGTERLAGLLGRRVKNPARIPLVELDASLRSSAAAAGLVTVTEALTGPLVDRKAARVARQEAQSFNYARLEEVLADAGVIDQPWVAEFMNGVRQAGILTRAGDGAGRAIGQAGAVLHELARAEALSDSQSQPRGYPDVVWELAELAGRCTGDAHGLDHGRLAAALVLRAAAVALRVRPAESASEARVLWGRLGVTADEISGSVLVWGLRPPKDDPWSTMMRARADLRLVTHLTLHELRGAAAGAVWAEPGVVVSVCENPQVLQAATRSEAASPLVCTSGNPSSAGWLLLRALVEQGVRMRYHGDFDWAGMSIAGRVLQVGVEPWRLGSEDYKAAVGYAAAVDQLSLIGRPVKTPWDARLAADMRRVGIAVHEEALLGVLLQDLDDV